MYKVKTPDGERFLVQLVGPKSYRMGAQLTYRGQTLTVTKRTRDYLVRKTSGAWADFDPTPVEPIEEVMPPQFGEPGGPMIDMNDIDPAKNPAMSMDHAHQLAAKGSENHVDVTDAYAQYAGAGVAPSAPDVEDLSQQPTGSVAPSDEAGDLGAKDLKPDQKATSGGKAAATAKGAAKPKGGVVLKNQPAPADAEATTVS